MLRLNQKARAKLCGATKAKKMQSDGEQAKARRILCARENAIDPLAAHARKTIKVRKVKCVIKPKSLAAAGKHTAGRKCDKVAHEDVKRRSKQEAAGTVIAVAAAAAEAPKPTSQPLAGLRVDGERLCYSYRRYPDVVDIDAAGKENPLLVTDYVDDIYDYLFAVEAKQSVRKHHLAKQVAFGPKMRGILVNWINELQQEFDLFEETFYMAVGIIDLYLQAVTTKPLTDLQLVGVAALMIAVKHEEVLVPSTDDFIYITDDAYTPAQLLSMEWQILRVLDFDLSRPPSIHFLRRFSKAAAADNVHHVMAKYFLELCAPEYDLASCRPSQLAAAALYLSLQLLNADAGFAGGLDASHWSKTLQHYSRYTAHDLGPLAQQIAALARDAPQAKLGAAYKKYLTEKFLKVAGRAELSGALIDSIINSK